MELIPAIDLRGGGVVRLLQGDFDAETRYALTPEELYGRYARAGARRVHVVDLDGARDGAAGNRPIVARLASLGRLRVQSGGGLRSSRDVQSLLAAGVERAVLGSVAVTAAAEVGEWFTEFGPDRLVLALDVRIDGHRWRGLLALEDTGDRGDTYDNKVNVARQAELRAERAKLLGYASHAGFVLEENMAKTPDQVYALLNQLWTPARAMALREAADQQALIKASGGTFTLEAADWRYYQEKIKQQRFALDEQAALCQRVHRPGGVAELRHAAEQLVFREVALEGDGLGRVIDGYRLDARIAFEREFDQRGAGSAGHAFDGREAFLRRAFRNESRCWRDGTFARCARQVADHRVDQRDEARFGQSGRVVLDRHRADLLNGAHVANRGMLAQQDLDQVAALGLFDERRRDEPDAPGQAMDDAEMFHEGFTTSGI